MIESMQERSTNAAVPSECSKTYHRGAERPEITAQPMEKGSCQEARKNDEIYPSPGHGGSLLKLLLKKERKRAKTRPGHPRPLRGSKRHPGMKGASPAPFRVRGPHYKMWNTRPGSGIGVALTGTSKPRHKGSAPSPGLPRKSEEGRRGLRGHTAHPDALRA